MYLEILRILREEAITYEYLGKLAHPSTLSTYDTAQIIFEKPFEEQFKSATGNSRSEIPNLAARRAAESFGYARHSSRAWYRCKVRNVVRSYFEAVLVTFATGHKIAGRFDTISLTKVFRVSVPKIHIIIFCTLRILCIGKMRAVVSEVVMIE